MALELKARKNVVFAGTTGNPAAISLTSGWTAGSGGATYTPLENDVVIVCFGIGAESSTYSPTIVTSGYNSLLPGGTRLAANGTSFDALMQVWGKRMGATPNTSVQVGPTSSARWAGAVSVEVWSGVDRITILDGTVTTAVSSTATDRANPPSASTTSANAAITVFGVGSAGATSVYTSSNLTNFLSNVQADTSDVVIGSGHSMRATAGAFDPALFGGTANTTGSSWVAASIPLKPYTGPVFTSGANASVAENATLAKTISVDTSSTFALSGADAAQFELSSAGPATSVTLRWASNGTKNFEAPNDTGTNNIYDVVVEATASGLTSSQSNAITVSNVSQPSATAWDMNVTSAWKTAGTVADQGGSWTNGNVSTLASSDDFRAETTVAPSITSSTLRLTNFGFSLSDVPSGNTIAGVEVRFEGMSSTDFIEEIPSFAVRLRKTAGVTGNNKTSSVATGDTIVTLGSSSDIWSATLSDSDVRSSDFGTDLSVTGNIFASNSQIFYLDHVEVRITSSRTGDPSIAANVADATHVANTNKTYHATNFAIVGGTNSTEFELYNNAGVLAVRTNNPSGNLTGGTSTVQIRDTTNGPAGSEEARTDTLSITVTGAGTPGNASGAMGSTVTVTAMGGAATGTGNAAGSLNQVTITALTGAGSGAGNVTAALATTTVTSLGGTASGSANRTATLGGNVTVTPMGGSGSGAANRTAALGATVTVTALTGTAGVSASTGGALNTVTVSALTGSATGSANRTATLGATVTVTPLAGAASGAGNATGALTGTVTVSALAGSATGTANASGALPTSTVTSLTGAGTGNASASGALNTVTVTALTGTATGTANTGGGFSTITLTALGGSASGDVGSTPGNASGAFGATVTTSALNASVVGHANITALLPTSTITAMAGTATGAAEAGGALTSVTITPLGGAGSGAGNASGALTQATVTNLTGVATGTASVSAALSAVTVTPMGGFAEGSGSGSANGAFGANVIVSSMAGSATGSAQASPPMSPVMVTSVTGTASGAANTSGVLTALGISPMDGSASGAGGAVGAMSSIILSTMGGAAIGAANVNGTLSGVTITPLEADVSATANASGTMTNVIINAMGGSAAAELFGPFTIKVRDARGEFRQIGPFTITG